MAGVVQTHIYRRFAWQAWHLWYWVAPLGRDLATPVAPRHFAWQAWHLVTSTFLSRGRRGTNSHLPSFCVAGVALMGFLACLRMSCAGMSYGRSGMLSFPTCFRLRIVCSTGLFAPLCFSMFDGRSGMFYPTCFVRGRSGMFAACLSSRMFLLSAWSLRQAGPRHGRFGPTRSCRQQL